MESAKEAVLSVAPAGETIEWSGQSREENNSSSSTMKTLAMALVFTFLCLAALYESWSVPFAVLFTVPTGIFGALFSEYAINKMAALLGSTSDGFQNSVYMQIGIIMIIGLAAKNAILIVEFAKERVDNGMDPLEAAVEAFPSPFPSDPHDSLHLHHRLPAAGACNRCGRRGQMRHGCCRRRRYDICYVIRALPDPGILYRNGESSCCHPQFKTWRRHQAVFQKAEVS